MTSKSGTAAGYLEDLTIDYDGLINKSDECKFKSPQRIRR